MENKLKLSGLRPGDIFTFAGLRWVKLEDLAEGTKVIARQTALGQKKMA